ncbi:MAG: SpoIIE family protein phosphatase, partial [Armatimonadota bacterium]|nr:SpoIIE family protein phosphatase [Armatimonadota bacterium]
DLPQVQPLLVQVLQTPGISPPVEFRMRHRDGSWRLLEAICSNLLDDPSVRGIVVNSRDVTERRALEEERERLFAESEARAEREALINRIGVILRNSPDADRLQPAVMQELGEALGADRCFFSFYDLPKDEVRITYDWHRSGLRPLTGCHGLSEILMVAQQLCGPEGVHVISDGRTCGWSEQAVAALESMELRSAICVPLVGHGQTVAVLCVAMAHDPRDWTPDEVRLVETIAAHTWTALETARSHQREHAIADSLQRALLPPVPRDVPELDFDTHYKAALAEANIGGDFYDVFPLEDGSYAFAVGDVSGKGLAAAQVATVRHMLRTVLYLGLTVAEAVTQLNMLVIDHGLLRGFVTLFVGVYDTRSGILTYVSCGHEPGLIRRAETSQIEELMPSGLPLGIQREERYTQNLVALSPGDALVLFTDGLSEAPSAERDLLGVSGVSRMLQESMEQESAPSLISSLVSGVADYAGADLRDDLCILAVVVRSVAAPSNSLSLMPAPEAVPRRRAEDQRPPLISCAAPHTALDSMEDREGEERYLRLMELSPDLIAIIQNGKFVSLNPAGCRLLGADGPETILGRSLLDVVHPHWRPVVQGRLRQLVPERIMEGIEQQWVRLDGEGVLVEMSAAATVYASEPALQIIVHDITNPREIQEQNVRLLCEVNVAAVRQRLFLRDVLASVTAGRLRLCEEPGDLPPCLNRYGERLVLSRKNLSHLRHRTREAALSLNMPVERCQDIESAVGEAAMNAVAHAGGGTGQVCVDASGTVQVWIQDEGAGIALEHLPQATLERGYTTANTLGHGFWIMLQTVDRVWLLTSPEGTTLVLEQGRTKSEPAWHSLVDDDTAIDKSPIGEDFPRLVLV